MPWWSLFHSCSYEGIIVQFSGPRHPLCDRFLNTNWHMGNRMTANSFNPSLVVSEHARAYSRPLETGLPTIARLFHSTNCAPL
ncbi:protein of unknown function [Acidithiobacillus ferrivorans]|uniref:Uncharacterized protein n=1 Tax=Acidithiobacillus ferrivorans TaxID=160808 RepID=A0A060URG2_9PROT|nr:hypothetical protein AFERRI_470004 [Acidithiobacillus ferrivorans]SMH65781.1 protein of unknown function [Acidithiobacillus ferrivorans]